MYEEIDYRILVIMCQWFAPTKMHITFEREGPGAFTDEELETMLTLDSRGRVSSLNLPKRAVLISNHQARAPFPVPFHATIP